MALDMNPKERRKEGPNKTDDKRIPDVLSQDPFRIWVRGGVWGKIDMVIREAQTQGIEGKNGEEKFAVFATGLLQLANVAGAAYFQSERQPGSFGDQLKNKLQATTQQDLFDGLVTLVAEHLALTKFPWRKGQNLATLSSKGRERLQNLAVEHVSTLRGIAELLDLNDPARVRVHNREIDKRATLATVGMRILSANEISNTDWEK